MASPDLSPSDSRYPIFDHFGGRGGWKCSKRSPPRPKSTFLRGTPRETRILPITTHSGLEARGGVKMVVFDPKTGVFGVRGSKKGVFSHFPTILATLRLLRSWSPRWPPNCSARNVALLATSSVLAVIILAAVNLASRRHPRFMTLRVYYTTTGTQDDLLG